MSQAQILALPLTIGPCSQQLLLQTSAASSVKLGAELKWASAVLVFHALITHATLRADVNREEGKGA